MYIKSTVFESGRKTVIDLLASAKRIIVFLIKTQNITMNTQIRSAFEAARKLNIAGSGCCWMPEGVHTKAINQMFASLQGLRHQLEFAVNLVKLWSTADENGAIELCGEDYVKYGLDPKEGLFGYTITGNRRQFRVWARTCPAFRVRCDDEKWDCQDHVDSGGYNCLVSIAVPFGCEDFLRDTCVELFDQAFPEFHDQIKNGDVGVRATFWTKRPLGPSYKEMLAAKDK